MIFSNKIHLVILIAVILVCSCKDVVKLMMVSTGEVSEKTHNSAKVTGQVIDGGQGYTEFGHSYSEIQGETDLATKVPAISQSEKGEYTTQLVNLLPGTIYYVRAYIKDAETTVYGKEINFTTSASEIQVPVHISSVIEDASPSLLEMTYSYSLADIVPDVSAFSVQVNSVSRSIATVSVSGTKVRLTLTTPVLPGDLITVTYTKPATNPIQTASGGQASSLSGVSVTNNCVPRPVVTTNEVSFVTASSATSGGNILSDGGSAVIARGVCWSTSQMPTIDLISKTDDGSGTGSFISSLTTLTSNTVYYVRAYATNSQGTAYGNQVSFTTGSSAVLPSVSTVDITSVTTTGALCGGNVTSDGGATVIARGVCWSTSSGPTVGVDPKTTDGSGTGTYPSTVADLTPNTLYYVRAYATNSAGTAYGNQVMLKSRTGSLTDIDGNLYYSVTIGTQVWMSENLKVTKYNDGTALTYEADFTQWPVVKEFYLNAGNNPANSEKYGRLYGGYVAIVTNSRNICPAGWHVPSESDWTILINYLGSIYGGDKLKEAGLSHWVAPNATSTNETGFTALPGGSAEADCGTSCGIEMNGNWWSSSDVKPKAMSLYWSDRQIFFQSMLNYDRGYSVRCIKNN